MGTHASPIGEIVGIASEHDPVAGTQRGQNAIFVFALDGVRLCHFGDFGQHSLRPEQRDAIGEIDVLFLPVGAGPTVGGEEAAADLGAKTFVMSGYLFQMPGGRAERHDTLMKPIRPRELVAAVERSIGKASDRWAGSMKREAEAS